MQAPEELADHIQAGIALQEEQLGEAAIRTRNWRYLAYIEACIILCSVWIIYDLGRQPKREPVYYEVDSGAQTIRPMGVKPPGWVPGEPYIKKHLFTITEVLRTVHDDKDLMRRDWTRAFHSFTEEGKKQFVAYFGEYKPLEKASYVKVELLGIHPRSPSTYYLRWVEKYENSQHVFQRQETWGAEFTFVQRLPQNADEEQWAPEGIYVQSFSFSREP